MRSSSVANPSPTIDSRIDTRPQWLTTAAAARMLQVTDRGVRFLARAGTLRFELTESGQRLFRLPDVLQVVQQRAQRRLLGTISARRTSPDDPRQLSLFGKARLRLVDRLKNETALPDAEAKASRSFKDSLCV